MREFYEIEIVLLQRASGMRACVPDISYLCRVRQRVRTWPRRDKRMNVAVRCRMRGVSQSRSRSSR